MGDFKRAGSEYIWESSQGKVSVKGNRWYHHYDKEGGYVIGFFQRFFDMTFQEAMLMLLEEDGTRYEPTEEDKKHGPFLYIYSFTSFDMIFCFSISCGVHKKCFLNCLPK